MTAQSITTDLTLIANAEPGTLASWTALGGGASGLAEETDYAVQGQTSISKQVKLETKGMHANNGSGISFAANAHVYVWMYSTTPGALDTRPNGGLRVTLGASGTARSEYYVNGRENYRYGGWICYPISPFSTADNVIGGGQGATPQYFGGVMSNSVTVKGVNFGVDVIRYGTGIDASGGGGGDPDLTFADISTQNDLQDNAWGVCQGTDSGVSLMGELRIGIDDTTSPTVFNDADKVLINPNKNPSDVNLKTTTTFTGVTLAGTQTNATFTGCSFLSLDAADKGIIDCDTSTNAVGSALFDGCVFQNWGNIGMTSTVDITNSKLTDCGQVTLNGGSINNCDFVRSAPVNAGTSLSNISNCNFTKANLANQPAIITNVGAGTYSLVGCDFTNYNASNDLPDSAIQFLATTGTIIVNISGGPIPTYQSLGAEIIMQTSSTLTLTGLQPNTEVRVYEAGTTTEIAGVENSGTSESFAIAVSAVDIVLHSLDYLNQRLANVNTSNDLILPVQQVIDRQYDPV